MKKLTKAQVRAHDKLLKAGRTSAGQSPYALQESIATLDALVAMGFATRTAGLGSTFGPPHGLEVHHEVERKDKPKPAWTLVAVGREPTAR